MKAFLYKGMDSHGDRVSGEIFGGGLEEVEKKLTAQDVTVISIVPAGMRRGRDAEDHEGEGSRPRRGKKVSDADAAVVLRNLAVMAETGVPFVEALDAVVSSARTPVILAELERLRSDIVGGKSLSAAMRGASALFPPIVSDMVKVAEEGGRLDKALGSAASHLERSAELRKRIVNAMLYPMVMLGVSVITVLILVVFVMPRFAGIFSKMGAEIPITTKLMLASGDFIRSNPIYFLAGVAVVVFAIWRLLRVPAVAKTVSVLLLRVPMLGPLLERLALSRAFQSIATLISSNVALMSALEHGAKVSGNPRISEALLRARVSVEHGGSLSEALDETKVFPKMLLQMVAVGERTGRLSQLLSASAASMEEEVDGRLKALVSIVEPVMIVVMGGVVGTITVSIIMPIYSVVQNIK